MSGGNSVSCDYAIYWALHGAQPIWRTGLMLPTLYFKGRQKEKANKIMGMMMLGTLNVLYRHLKTRG